MISDLKVESRQTKQSQIAEFVRDKILSGEFSADDRLPSTQALSKKWQLPKATVHRALSVLVKEGLLSRKPKIGTIVNHHIKTLTAVAVYVRQNMLHPASAFTRLAVGFVENELNARNVECKIFYENKENGGFQQIKELAEKRLIQGVILITADRNIRPKFEKLPIPFSCMTSAQVKNRVFEDRSSMVDNVIKAFKNLGCKKIGLLLSIKDVENPMESGERERNHFFKYLKQQAVLHDIEIRDEWVYTTKNKNISLSQYDKFAFDGFYKIWSSDEKPDGLFVYTDDLITGTLLAIMQKRVMIPEDLKLVFHRNAENNILCPVPCYFVENSVRDMAEGLVQLIFDQFNGKEIQQVKLNYKLHKHKGE